MFVLRFVPYAPPASVIAILLAASRIAAHSLDVTIAICTDPNVGPGWWHRDRVDSREFVAIIDNGAFTVAIDEPVNSALSSNSWPLIAHVTQVRTLGGELRGINRKRSQVGGSG